MYHSLQVNNHFQIIKAIKKINWKLVSYGGAARRRAEAEQVPAADPGDWRLDQGARDPLQEGSEVQQEREQIQPQTEDQCGVRSQDDVLPLCL